MGQVYLARSTGLGGFERRVVVKTLDPNTTEDDEAFVTMFLDEARLLDQLHHQYIAPIYEDQVVVTCAKVASAVADETGETVYGLDVWCEDDSGRKLTVGEATVHSKPA